MKVEAWKNFSQHQKKSRKQIIFSIFIHITENFLHLRVADGLVEVNRLDSGWVNEPQERQHQQQSSETSYLRRELCTTVLCEHHLKGCHVIRLIIRIIFHASICWSVRVSITCAWSCKFSICVESFKPFASERNKTIALRQANSAGSTRIDLKRQRVSCSVRMSCAICVENFAQTWMTFWHFSH